MRAQSLWTNLQGIPYPVFDLQGDSPIGFVREIQSRRWQLETGARPAGSKRNSRSVKRLGIYQVKEATKECEIGSSKTQSKAANLLPCRNSQTTQCSNG